MLGERKAVKWGRQFFYYWTYPVCTWFTPGYHLPVTACVSKPHRDLECRLEGMTMMVILTRT